MPCASFNLFRILNLEGALKKSAISLGVYHLWAHAKDAAGGCKKEKFDFEKPLT